jgi:hypothetical protein
MSLSEPFPSEPPKGSDGLGSAPDLASSLNEKLMEMTLYDDTGDPRDEGYMDAVREIRTWLNEFR